MATLVRNHSLEGPLPLPAVYGAHLIPVGGAVIIADTPANVAAALGNPPATVCTFDFCTDGQAGAISPATSGLSQLGIGAALVISGNLVAPTAPVHHVGAGLIKNITPPAVIPAGTAPKWTAIPDNAFTYDNTGNIVVPAGGGTAVVGRLMEFIYDPGTSKWYPSY